MLCGAGRSPYVRGSVFDIGLSGGHRRGEIPVPMPNTVVKLSSADGTARVTVWESRSLPGVFSKTQMFQVDNLGFLLLSIV